MVKLISALMIVLSALLVGCKNNGTDSEQFKSVAEKNWEVIEIEGLTREYEFLYLTDSHLILLNGSEDDEITQHAKERMQNFAYGNEFTIEEQFELWLAEAGEENVDAVLLGGDTVDFPSDANINYLNERLSELTSEYGVPYLYVPGNHDWSYPWEYMTDYARDNYLERLKPYMKSNPAIQQLEFEEFIVVAVDNSTNQIAPDALDIYEEVLQKDKPVIVMLHVPLLTQSALTKANAVWGDGMILGGGNYGGIYPNKESMKFINLTTAENSPVVAVLAGHVHFYDKDMINENIIQIVGDAAYKGKAMWIKLKPAG